MFGKNKQMVCAHCGCTEKPKIKTKGSFAVEILLYIFGFIGGMIYTAWRKSNMVEICAACGAEDFIPVDSPKGRKLIADNQVNES